MRKLLAILALIVPLGLLGACEQNGDVGQFGEDDPDRAEPMDRPADDQATQRWEEQAEEPADETAGEWDDDEDFGG